MFDECFINVPVVFIKKKTTWKTLIQRTYYRTVGTYAYEITHKTWLCLYEDVLVSSQLS